MCVVERKIEQNFSANKIQNDNKHQDTVWLKLKKPQKWSMKSKTYHKPKVYKKEGRERISDESCTVNLARE